MTDLSRYSPLTPHVGDLSDSLRYATDSKYLRNLAVRPLFACLASAAAVMPGQRTTGPNLWQGEDLVMTSQGVSQSITRLIRKAQDGRPSAVGPLLAAYFERLVRLARQRLQGRPGLTNYDEDVALRAFHSVYQRVGDPGRPLVLEDRDDLWRLLATRTISRSIDLIRQHRPSEVPDAKEVELLLTREPTPAEVAEMTDECRRLLDLLDEPDLRQIALWKVEGYTHEEIAAKLDCVPRTIERKVSRIRLLWKHELKKLEA
jgi:RNA polymerase sigma factor (sigma-70 family)